MEGGMDGGRWYGCREVMWMWEGGVDVGRWHGWGKVVSMKIVLIGEGGMAKGRW